MVRTTMTRVLLCMSLIFAGAATADTSTSGHHKSAVKTAKKHHGHQVKAGHGHKAHQSKHAAHQKTAASTPAAPVRTAATPAANHHAAGKAVVARSGFTDHTASAYAPAKSSMSVKWLTTGLYVMMGCAMALAGFLVWWFRFRHQKA